MNYHIVQIYFSDETRAKCYDNPKVEHFYNSTLTPYFENSVICQVKGMIPQYDYFGVWSWKHREKVQGHKFTFEEMEKILPNVDVLAFQRFLRNGRIFSGEYEKTYERIFNEVMVRLNLKYRFPNRAGFIVMQNHFICKAHIYTEYIEKILEPAMQIIDSIPESNGHVEYRDKKMEIQAGYTYKPFLCEKLFTAFLNERDYICQQW